MKHDAHRQIGYIQQALSQNRKSIGIFLGAGCPLSVRINSRCEIETKKEYSDPLIQDVAGLTQIITHKFNNGSIYQYYGIPQNVWNDFKNAGSKGQFIHQQLKGQYRYARV